MPKKKAICTDCGKRTYVEQHHEPPRSQGGINTIPLCRACHTARHCANNDWAKWGQLGGKKTAANPDNWKRNLKQYQTKPSRGSDKPLDGPHPQAPSTP